jgi:KDO2-lipid IV(A) lauroyltransferase
VRSTIRKNLEYWAALTVVRGLGLLPRGVARVLANGLAFSVFWLHGRLRRVGHRNLAMAMPELSAQQRTEILRRVYIHLGWQLVEFCHMPRYTRENTSDWIRTEGMEHYWAAQARGKGVLIITGHLGAWELMSLYHSMVAEPLNIVIRRLDNRKLDEFVNGIRCMYGSRMIHKDDFGRGLMLAMRKGETVGILMDTNMSPPQGSFVKFFGIEACTATGLAHIARKTGAAILPAFCFWEKSEGRYVIRLGEEIAVPHTSDAAADILETTQMATAAIEGWIRRYPDQWLWIHRRWKTRPPGEAPLY